MNSKLTKIIAGATGISTIVTSAIYGPEIGDYLIEAMNIAQNTNESINKAVATGIIKSIPTATGILAGVYIATIPTSTKYNSKQKNYLKKLDNQ